MLLFVILQFRCELNNVMSLRLILQQPSPVWREFKLEDLRLFRSPGVSLIVLIDWLSRLIGWFIEGSMLPVTQALQAIRMSHLQTCLHSNTDKSTHTHTHSHILNISMTGWLIGWLIRVQKHIVNQLTEYPLTDWLIDWLTGWLIRVPKPAHCQLGCWRSPRTSSSRRRQWRWGDVLWRPALICLSSLFLSTHCLCTWCDCQHSGSLFTKTQHALSHQTSWHPLLH